MILLALWENRLLFFPQLRQFRQHFSPTCCSPAPPARPPLSPHPAAPASFYQLPAPRPALASPALHSLQSRAHPPRHQSPLPGHQLPRPQLGFFHFYNDRAECENQIEEFKNGFHADRLSSHRVLANQRLAFSVPLSIGREYQL